MVALPLRKHLVTNRSTRTIRAARAESKHSRLQSPTPSKPADDADHALANIRAWTDLLVARGNRLVELAVREREAISGDKMNLQQSIARQDRGAAVAFSNTANRPDRLRKEHAGPR